MNLFTKIAAGVALTAGVAFGANAGQISGSIQLDGITSWKPVGSTNIALATGFDLFNNALAVKVGAATTDGDFLSAVGASGSMKDLPIVANVPPSIANFWVVGGFSFTLESAVIDFQNANGMLISGTGTVSHAGFDNTFGNFHWSGNKSKTALSFSATGDATPVPEPMSLVILGAGLLGLGAARRRAAQA